MTVLSDLKVSHIVFILLIPLKVLSCVAVERVSLRKLISTCELYAKENDNIYNVRKTEYMIVKPSSMRTSEFPPLYL